MANNEERAITDKIITKSTNLNLDIVIKTYAPNLDVFMQLQADIKQHCFFKGHIYVIVPERDMDLFRSILDADSRLLTVESVLQVWEYKITESGFGETWVNQQIIKLLAPKIVEMDQYLILDSNTLLNYDFDESHFLREDENGCRLFIYATDDFDDQEWEISSRAVLGLDHESTPIYGFRSVNQIFIAGNVMRLAEYLQKRFGNADFVSVLLTFTWTEYNLYGLFCKCILKDQSNHYFTRVDDVMFVTKTVMETPHYLNIIHNLRPLMIKLYKKRPIYTLSDAEYDKVRRSIKSLFSETPIEEEK